MKINSLEEAKQFAFETSVRGLASQGWKRCAIKSKHDDDDMCLWNLGEPGFHCALGWLIPWPNQEDCNESRPGLVQDIQENYGIHISSSAFGRLIPELQEWMLVCEDEDRISFLDFLKTLQRFHDRSNDIKQDFLKGAKAIGVKWPEDANQ